MALKLKNTIPFIIIKMKYLDVNIKNIEGLYTKIHIKLMKEIKDNLN